MLRCPDSDARASAIAFSSLVRLMLSGGIGVHEIIPLYLRSAPLRRGGERGKLLGYVALVVGWGLPASFCLTAATFSFVTGSQERCQTWNMGRRERFPRARSAR